MKKVIFAALAAVVAANSAMASPIRDLDGSIESRYLKQFENVQLDEVNSKIHIVGETGHQFGDVQTHRVIDYVAEQTGVEFEVTQKLKHAPEGYELRDWVEYKVTNKGRTFYVTESNGGQGDLRAIHKRSWEGNEEAVDHTYRSYFDDSFTITDSNQWCTTEYDWVRCTDHNQTLDDNYLTVESNFNSRNYFEDMQGYDVFAYRQAGIGETDVNKVEENEQAKQVVALTAAYAFDKFDNISGQDLRTLFQDHLNSKGSIDRHTVGAILSPSGDIK